MDVINVLMYFVAVTLLFQLLAKHSSAVYHVGELLTNICKHVNDSSATPHYTQIFIFAIIKLLLLFNTTYMAKMNNMDSTKPVTLSVNELTAEYWNSYVN